MELSNTAVEEFQQVYEQEFGEELEYLDAQLMATKLLQLCVALQHADSQAGKVETQS